MYYEFWGEVRMQNASARYFMFAKENKNVALNFFTANSENGALSYVIQAPEIKSVFFRKGTVIPSVHP